jgi:hypothetical protein
MLQSDFLAVVLLCRISWFGTNCCRDSGAPIHQAFRFSNLRSLREWNFRRSWSWAHYSGVQRWIQLIRNNAVGINFTTEVYTDGGDSLTIVTPNNASNTRDVASSRAAVAGQKSFYLSAVGFGNNTFIILGESGEILISQDGESWQAINGPTSATLTGIAWGQAIRQLQPRPLLELTFNLMDNHTS